MSRTCEIAVDTPTLRTTRTRMPRRNAIVKRKRGRTNKSDGRLQTFDDSNDALNDVACNNLSPGSVTTTQFPEATEEEQRSNNATVHRHTDLMPLKELAMLLSTQLSCAQKKGLFGRNVSTRKLLTPSEKGRRTTVASD